MSELMKRFSVEMVRPSGRTALYHGEVNDGWICVVADYVLKLDGEPLHMGSYKWGTGHVKLPRNCDAFSLGATLTADEETCFWTVSQRPNAKILPGYQQDAANMFAKVANARNGRYGPKLVVEELVANLLMEGSADFDALTFEEWCADYGFDDDSRKAYNIFQECWKIGAAFRRRLTTEEIDSLREETADL